MADKSKTNHTNGADADAPIQETPNVTDESPSLPSLVVGLGASAGGVAALKRFFAQMPADSGMTFVVILHLSPNHDSELAVVLRLETPMPVSQVTENVRYESNRVYVISPNHHLVMDDGHLKVMPFQRSEDRRAPVDIFLRTLAQSHDSRAVAVILSGTGANGSMGVRRIKEMGGVVFVQAPEDAEFDEMPSKAIASGLVDYVLPVEEIPHRIIQYRDSASRVQLPQATTPTTKPPTEREAEDEAALRDVLTSLRVRTGHDFLSYKRATVLRRLARRMGVHNLDGLPKYAAFVREHADELHALLKDLLISVTNYFRDHEAFAQVERAVIPTLFVNKQTHEITRVWVAGCATGEEAYSMAMLLSEYAESKGVSVPPFQVFATDIDEDAISFAREGLYSEAAIADVSEERVRRFFKREPDGFRVRKELREAVLFASHNVIRDPPFSRLDLISCRNLFIYLNRTAQETVLSSFYFALRPGGFLFLGAAESPEDSSDLFVAVDKQHRIYQSRTPKRATLPDNDFVIERHVERLRPASEVKRSEPAGFSSKNFAPLIRNWRTGLTSCIKATTT